MRFAGLLILLTVLSLAAWAQQAPPNNHPGKISGRIVDSASTQPIEYASVTIPIPLYFTNFYTNLAQVRPAYSPAGS